MKRQFFRDAWEFLRVGAPLYAIGIGGTIYYAYGHGLFTGVQAILIGSAFFVIGSIAAIRSGRRAVRIVKKAHAQAK